MGNKGDIEEKLEREAKERMDEQEALRQKVDDGINRLTDDIEGSKDILMAKIEKECGNVRGNLQERLVGLGDKLGEVSQRLTQELEQEKKDRASEKEKTYADFEQICRNIDDRVTGEKEKLWEKLKEDETKNEEQAAKVAAQLDAVSGDLEKEREERKKEAYEVL